MNAKYKVTLFKDYSEEKVLPHTALMDYFNISEN